ncbi:MAG: MFS transporter [Candidatus Bathyarchaeia archaeon]
MSVKHEFEQIFSLLRGNFLVITIGLAWYRLWGGFFDPYVAASVRILGGSSFVVGALTGVVSLSGALARIPGGYICDYVGRRRIAMIGVFISWSAMLLRALTATDWRILFITQSLWSISNFWTIAEQVILMDSLPNEKRALGFAINSAILGLANLASPYFGGVILERYEAQGVRVVLLLIPIMYTVKCILYWKFLKESFVTTQQQITHFSFSNVRHWTTTAFVETFRTFKLMSKSLRGFCIVNIIFIFALSLVGYTETLLFLPWSGTFFLLYAQDAIRLTLSEWGLIIVLTSGTQTVLYIFGGRIIDLYGKRWAVLAFFSSVILTALGFINSQNYSQTFIVLILGSIASSITIPAWRALEADLTPIEIRGRVSALYGLLGCMFALIGSLFGGYSYGINPKFPFLLFIMFGTTTTAIVYLTVLRRVK